MVFVGGGLCRLFAAASLAGRLSLPRVWREQGLDYYLDEFTFRFNRRRSRARGLLFYRLLQQAVVVATVPYNRLVGGKARSTTIGSG